MRSRPARQLTRALALLLLAGAASAAIVPAAPASADAIRDREYWLSDYGIRDAWAVTRGEGVTIAIIDSGVDAEHPALAGAVIGGTDVSGRGSPTGTTPLGPEGITHGTMVASLAAGRGTGPESGVIGAAPAASILSISLVFGPGEREGDVQIAEGVRWAVDNGADIISLSLTRNTVSWPESWDDAFGYAEANDVVVVAAAGNRGNGTAQVGAPATMPGVLAVGGVDRSGRASDEASSQGITIGVMAPSEGLVGATPGGGYANWQGTSGATPIVAGIAALVRAAHPDLDAAGVINRIVTTARPVTTAVPDPLYGYGLVDASAAVRAVVAPVAANPLGTLAEWIVVNRRVGSDDVVAELPAAHAPVARVPESAGLVATLRPIGAAFVSVALVLVPLLGVSTALGMLVLVGMLRFVARRGSE